MGLDTGKRSLLTQCKGCGGDNVACCVISAAPVTTERGRSKKRTSYIPVGPLLSDVTVAPASNDPWSIWEISGYDSLEIDLKISSLRLLAFQFRSVCVCACVCVRVRACVCEYRLVFLEQSKSAH